MILLAKHSENQYTIINATVIKQFKMKKITILLAILWSSQSYSQYSECDKKIQELNAQEKRELDELQNNQNGVIGSNATSISAKYFELRNKVENECQQLKQNSRAKVQTQQPAYINHRTTIDEIHQKQQKAIDNQQAYFNDFMGSLRSFNNAMMMKSIADEMNRRNKVANNFFSENGRRLNALSSMYENINAESLNKPLDDGKYNAHFIGERVYTFSNRQTVISETPCVVEVKDNAIIGLYLYGKNDFAIDLPTRFPKQSILSNGIVQYNDFQNLATYKVLIIEPYINSDFTQPELKTGGVGQLVFWSSDKDDADKPIYVQELDKKGNLVREFDAKVLYAKNEKVAKENASEYSVISNSGNEFLFLGQLTQSSFGEFCLYPKVNNKLFKEPLKENEVRYVEIKKYRE